MRLRSRAPFAVLAVAGALLATAQLNGLRLNLTASLPVGLYRRLERPVGLGDLVAVCPPAEVVRLARSRGYLPAGRCLGGGMPLLKRVVAVEGQVVTLGPEGVAVDGRVVQAPAPTVDRRGRALLPLPPGRYLLSKGQLWLATPSPRSFDSRYFGPIHRDAVLAMVVPLWTWAPPSDLPRSSP